VRRAWLHFLKRLRRAGYAASPALGGLELAEAAATALPAEAADIRRIGDLYTRCRYAPDPPDSAQLQRAVRDFRPKRKPA